MRLLISCVLGLNRATGKVDTLAQVVSTQPGQPVPEVGIAFTKFRLSDSEGDALRAKYSCVMQMIENQVRENLEIPDPEIERLKQLRAKRTELEAEVARLAAVEKTAKAAATNARAATEARKEAEARLAELGDIEPKPAPSALADPKKEQTPAEALAELDFEQLKAVAVRYGITDGLASLCSSQPDSKEQLIKEILAVAGYK